MGQLAKQMAERPTGTFGANAEMNPKEECKIIFTRRESAEKEKRIEEDVSDKKGEKKKAKNTQSQISHQEKPHSQEKVLLIHDHACNL